MNATNVFVTPEGESLVIPDDIFAVTKFAKGGWPDKRVKANEAFYAWLAAPKQDAAAQAYANRVWAGQSDSLHRKERLERVEAALKGQGLSMDGVVL